jgi:CHRD domain
MKRLVFASLVAGALLIVVAASAAMTHNNNGKSGKASLDSFQEVPTLATTGRGSFRVRVRSDGLHYKLSYSDVESNVLFAHIHLGRTAVNGGVIAFLCGGGDKPACPLREGTVEGVIDAADVIGPAGQGIPAGDLSDAVRSLRKGAVYANVHTTTFPAGEIRGQVNANKGKHNGKGKDRGKR